MQYIIKAPRLINTNIKLPASKSISNRALIIHAQTGGTVAPENLSDCDDTEVIINALRDMPEVIDIKAGGTAMRFMTAYLATLNGHEHVITGTERMQHRPISVLVNALRYMGADIEYEKETGFPPLRIIGKELEGGQVEMLGSVSSQFISAILLIGPCLRNGLELKLKGEIISRPYIDLTLWMMNEFGADANWTASDTVSVKPQPYKQRQYLIENDWSASSYWFEAMALSENIDSQINLSGLMDGSKQGDSVVRYLYSMLGVKTLFQSKEQGTPTTVTLKKSRRVVPRLDYDFINSPDLAQTVVVSCCALGIPFHFRGLSTLKIKETDRIAALKTELRKLGFLIKDPNDSELLWDGDRCTPTMEPIDTYEDHRMAMSFAPLALVFGEITINNPEVVSKSYPNYWSDMRAAGFEIIEIDN